MLWILDLDGVVWLADRPIPGSAEAVRSLVTGGDRVAFTTNNAFLTRDAYVAKLATAGIDADPDDVVSSAQAAASLLHSGDIALTCAGPGISEALSDYGVKEIPIRSGEDFPIERADAVVVGYHLDFGYQTLSAGARAIREGARFIGTNADPTYPTPNGLLAGTGALLAAFSVASGIRPTLAGKPYQPIVDLVRERFGIDGHECTVVGDRPSTDGAFARRLGARFALVESGVTPRGSAPRDGEPRPDLVAADLGDLVTTGGAPPPA